MSWLKYGTIGAIVGAALLFGDDSEECKCSFDDFENEFEDRLENETHANPEIVPEV